MPAKRPLNGSIASNGNASASKSSRFNSTSTSGSYEKLIESSKESEHRRESEKSRTKSSDADPVLQEILNEMRNESNASQHETERDKRLSSSAVNTNRKTSSKAEMTSTAGRHYERSNSDGRVTARLINGGNSSGSSSRSRPNISAIARIRDHDDVGGRLSARERNSAVSRRDDEEQSDALVKPKRDRSNLRNVSSHTNFKSIINSSCKVVVYTSQLCVSFA